MSKGVKNNLSLLIVVQLLFLLPLNHFPLSSGGAVSNFFSRKITLLLTINYILGHGILANMSFFDNWNTWWGMSYIPIKHCIQEKKVQSQTTHIIRGAVFQKQFCPIELADTYFEQFFMRIPKIQFFQDWTHPVDAQLLHGLSAQFLMSN